MLMTEHSFDPDIRLYDEDYSAERVVNCFLSFINDAKL